MENVSKPSSSLEEGPEYRAMRESNAMMVELLKPAIESLGDVLFARQLIPLDVKENIRFIPSPANKTREVLDCITGRIKYTPQIFREFITILQEQGTWTEVVVDQLFSCYQSQTTTPQPSSSLTPSHSQGGNLHYTLPSDVIKMMVQSVRVTLLDQNRSVQIESPMKVEGDNTKPQPNTATQISWDTDPKSAHGAIGTRDVLLLVSKVSGVNIIPRRNRPPLTEEEKHKLQEQGIHEDFCHNDLSIMTARHDLDKKRNSAGVLTGEKTTCKEVRQRITELLNITNKDGVLLHYIGPGQRETGNWCFKDGFFSFEEVMELYTQHLKPRGRILTIVSDCSYSGCWVKEAMTFMEGQGVGPCGHQAKENEILVKVIAACLTNEIPAELAFSTHCTLNTDVGTVCYKSIQLRGEEIHDNQHPSVVDFTEVRCNNTIDQPCTMAPQSTWKQWSSKQRTVKVTGIDRDRQVWLYLQLEDDEEKNKEFDKKQGGPMDVTNYGKILKSGWGKDPSEEEKKCFENYHINYNYQPPPDTTD